MTLNVPLLSKTLDHIIAHPDEWNQSMWVTTIYPDGHCVEITKNVCKTAFCFAGHAAFLSGADPVWKGDGYLPTDVIDHRTGRSVAVSEYATEQLGLTPVQAEDLFEASNSLEDLQRVVAEIIASA